MYLATELRKRVMGESMRGAPAGEGSAEASMPVKIPKLRDAFFSPKRETGVKESDSSFFGASRSEEEAARYSPMPLISMGPQLEHYDKLALILHASLERRNNRRRLHEYEDTFYGKHAVDWLVGTQTFPDKVDARNAMRHLLNRRLIIRADHTKPLFNGALERVAPKMAQSRRVDLLNRYASPARGFHDDHLYRFPPEAYSKIQLNVRVVRARNLRFRGRPQLGSFIISAKFRDQRIDPYCLLEFGQLSAKTDTWSDGGTTPVWESEFFFPVETGLQATEPSMKELYIRVLDFHEVLDDLELGYCLVPREAILKNCAAGRVWTAWHSLKAAAELSANKRTSGEVELELSLSPFVASNPLWTVHKDARAREPEGADLEVELEDASDMLTATFERVGDVVSHLGGQVNKIVDQTGVRDGGNRNNNPGTAVAEADKEEKDGEVKGRRFKLQIYRCQLAPNLADLRAQSIVWAEYTVFNNAANGLPYRGRSEMMTWPVKDFGLTSIRGLTQDDIQNASQRPVWLKVYAKVAGITVKIGETTMPLKTFMPDLDADAPTANLDEIEWKTLAKQEKVILRRTAAFRRNRKRIVGEVGLKAIVEPDNSEEDDDGSIFGEEAADESQANMMLEDDLSNVASMIAENGFSVPPPLHNMVLKETFKECPLGALFWYILSKNSPLLTAFSAKKNFTNLTQADWKWGGRERRTGSYIEEDPILALADASKGGPLINRASNSERTRAGSLTPESGPEPSTSAPSSPVKTTTAAPSVGAKLAVEASKGFFPPPLVKQESLTHLNALQEEKRLPTIPSSNQDPPNGSEESKTSAELPDEATAAKTEPEQSKVLNATATSGKTASLLPDESQKTLGTLDESSNSQSGGEEFPSRLVTYTRPPEMAVGELQVKETWRLKAFGAEKGFWLEVEGTTNEPMYGKQMSVVVQLVGVPESETSCTLTVSSAIKWTSRPMTAGIVERTATPATTKSYQLYVSVLKSIMRKKTKGKKDEEEEEEEGTPTAGKTDKRRNAMIVCLIILRLVALLLVIGLIIAVLYYIFIVRRNQDIAWVHDPPKPHVNTKTQQTEGVVFFDEL